jgi:ABC-type branched-subunit amino acid transport system ATPase component
MTILKMDNVSKSFGGVCAVDNMSLGFEEGRVSCLVGPNGAGKTTLFNLITGFIRPDRGHIYYRDRDISSLAPWQIARLGVGRLFQDIRVFNRLAVLDNVLAAFKDQSGEKAMISLITPWRVAREERRMVERAREFLALVGLEGNEESLAEDLSYGQQKLLSIARLLAADADVLLLDEPTAGVTPVRVKALLDLIKKLADAGKTVAVIEHNMSAVFEIADWVYFIDEGQVTSFGIPNEVLGDPNIRAAYMGL